MEYRLKEAFGITATFFVLALIGMALSGELHFFMTGTGLISLVLTFGLFYLAILVWVLCVYRKG